MTSLPKPTRRGPKPRKRIARNRSPIPRRTRPRPLRKGAAAEARRADRAQWSRMVLMKSPGGLCVRCLCCKATDAAHGFSKGAHPSVRLDPNNGAPLCRACHDDGHAYPEAWLRWFKSYLGAARFAALEARAYGRQAALRPKEEACP